MGSYIILPVVGQDDTGCFKLRINSIKINILSDMHALFPQSNDFGTFEWTKKKICCLSFQQATNVTSHQAINHCSHSWWYSLGEVQDGETQDIGPGNEDVQRMNKFNESTHLHLSIYRKV